MSGKTELAGIRMMRFARKARVSTLRLLVLMAACFAIAVPANAMQVSPLAVELNVFNTGVGNQFTVSNDTNAPLPLELSAARITMDADGKVTEGAAGDQDLLILPIQATIPPGQTQNFRVQYVGDPGIAQSQSYFVHVNQVPIKLPEGQSGVQMVYNFRVLANVAPAAGAPSLSVESTSISQAEGKSYPVVVVRNAGNVHAMLSFLPQLTIVQKNASGAEIFRKSFSTASSLELFGLGLVMPNSVRRFVLPVELPASSGTISVGLGE
ncbi:MAG: hypothetical protein QM698_07050 [Micropepsaceae bacterium]